jgi:alginate O-acetyltransferase complex protein AlgI
LYIGPINRFQSFLKDNQRKRWDSQFFSYGLERILYGLFKVAFLGNYLISLKLSNYSENFIISYPWLYQYIQMVVFYLNAYFQFAGFSDIAIGLSALFGYRIMENFNYPFVASNIAEFWKRWHISLSEWCNEYVFQPILSISRSFIISIFFSIIVLALWHEISYKYILWGALHIIALNVWHFYNSTALYQLLNKYPIMQKVLGIFITLHFVMISFMLIKTDDLTYFWNFIKILFLVN